MMKRPFPIRAVQLDLARQMETIDFIRQFIDFIAEYHYNTLFLYLEWRVRTKAFDIGEGEGYSAEEMREVVDYAKGKGIDVIPGLASLGHAELLLGKEEFASYAEVRDGILGREKRDFRHVFCPSNPQVLQFLENYFTEIAAIFPSSYLHIGGDEAWDIAICPDCRKRAPDFRREENIFLEHIRFCHRIVTGKLHKHMMMWDDMLETYSDILPDLPKDIILVNWQYQQNVIGYQGHFANLTFRDVTEEYERLGLQYMIAPATGTWTNVETFTQSHKKSNLVGALLTMWEKKEDLLYKLFPLIAGTGILWSSEKPDSEAALTQAIRQIFGIADETFIQTIRQYVNRPALCEYIAGSSLRSVSYFGPNLPLIQSIRTMECVLAQYRDKVSGLAGKILADIEDKCLMYDVAQTARKYAVQCFNNMDPEPVENLLAKIDKVAARQIQACAETRRPCDVKHFEVKFDRWRKALADFQQDLHEKGVLTVLFCLPDTYSAERLRIYIGENGVYRLIESGVRKEDTLAQLYFYRFFIPADMTVDSIRIEAEGFGGQGICYMSAKTAKGVFVPFAVLGTEGMVEHPEHVLTHDANFCFMGDQHSLNAFHDRTKGDMVHRLDIAMKEEPVFSL